MRYRDIIDFDDETQAEREERLRVMYGIDEADRDAQDAETDLAVAKADKLRAEALAAVVKVEAEYEELALRMEQELLDIRMLGTPVPPRN